MSMSSATSPLPHILCISCPASKDYSQFFHKLLINAFKRQRDRSKPNAVDAAATTPGEQKSTTTTTTKKKKKKKKKNSKKKQHRFPFTYDSIVLNNATLAMSKTEFDRKIAKASALIISGSSNSAYDQEPWIDYLKETIVQAHKQATIRLVGICFGHQLIAQALGGRVAANPEGHETAVCRFTATQEGLDYLNKLSNSHATSQELSLFCWHGDCVLELPTGCNCGGSNENTSNQYYYNKKNILCFQAHPEFNAEWTLTLGKKYYPKEYSRIEAAVNAQNDQVLKDAVLVNDAIYHFCGEEAAAAAAAAAAALHGEGTRRYRSFRDCLNDPEQNDQGMTNRDKMRALIESRGGIMM